MNNVLYKIKPYLKKSQMHSAMYYIMSYLKKESNEQCSV